MLNRCTTMLCRRLIMINLMMMSERIREAIENGACTSYAEVARQLGVSKGAISKWVSDETKNLRLNHLFRLSDITGYSARWIAIGDGPKLTVDAVKEFYANKIALDETIFDMSAEEKGRVFDEIFKVMMSGKNG